jgi:hypothetical protein
MKYPQNSRLQIMWVFILPADSSVITEFYSISLQCWLCLLMIANSG